MLGKGNRPKAPGLFDYDPVTEKNVAPLREIMFAFTDENKAQCLTPREIVEQCRNLKALAGEIEMLVGLWDRAGNYHRILSRIQSAIRDTNDDTRRIRRKAARAIVDAKTEAMRPLIDHRRPVDDAA